MPTGLGHFSQIQMAIIFDGNLNRALFNRIGGIGFNPGRFFPIG